MKLIHRTLYLNLHAHYKRVFMKRLLALLVMLVCSSALAFRDDPLQSFGTGKNFTNQTAITWLPVNNVQVRCEAESRKRGLGGFGYSVEACAFWDKSYGQHICTIITSKETNMHTLGHEVRHCFQGSWH
jgi:hypothetical protein